jgi:hypothetical protein
MSVHNIAKTLVLSMIFIGLMSGCASTHNTSRSARTAIEQLLISEAVIRSLPAESLEPLPIPQGSTVILNSSGLSPDQMLLQQIVAGWLGQKGYHVQTNEQKATHRVNILVRSLGTELGTDFIGMPPIQSVLIPFSLPELSLYKAQFQTGYVKFHMDVFDLEKGEFAGSTPPFVADTYYNDYTVLFAISFTSTDLGSSPEFDSPVTRASTLVGVKEPSVKKQKGEVFLFR